MKNKAQTVRQVLARVQNDLEFLQKSHEQIPHITKKVYGCPSLRSLIALQKKINRAFEKIDAHKDKISEVEDALVSILLLKKDSIKDSAKILRLILTEKYPDEAGKVGI